MVLPVSPAINRRRRAEKKAADRWVLVMARREAVRKTHRLPRGEKASLAMLARASVAQAALDVGQVEVRVRNEALEIARRRVVDLVAPAGRRAVQAMGREVRAGRG
jgi:hypothetical protein